MHLDDLPHDLLVEIASFARPFPEVPTLAQFKERPHDVSKVRDYVITTLQVFARAQIFLSPFTDLQNYNKVFLEAQTHGWLYFTRPFRANDNTLIGSNGTRFSCSVDGISHTIAYNLEHSPEVKPKTFAGNAVDIIIRQMQRPFPRPIDIIQRSKIKGFDASRYILEMHIYGLLYNGVSQFKSTIRDGVLDVYANTMHDFFLECESKGWICMLSETVDDQKVITRNYEIVYSLG